MIVSLMLTWATEAPENQVQLRQIMDAFVAAVPEDRRMNSNVSVHDPEDVVISLQLGMLAPGAVRHVNVWHTPSGDVAGVGRPL